MPSWEQKRVEERRFQDGLALEREKMASQEAVAYENSAASMAMAEASNPAAFSKKAPGSASGTNAATPADYQRQTGSAPMSTDFARNMGLPLEGTVGTGANAGVMYGQSGAPAGIKPTGWTGPTAPAVFDSGGAAGALGSNISKVGNSYSQTYAPTPPGSYDPNPNVSYGDLKPVLGLPSFGDDPTELMRAFADGGEVIGPEGMDQVPAEMPDGAPARLDDGEFVLPKDYVVAYAAKALGKKGAGLAPEKLHALGIDLLTQDVTTLTGKPPGPKAMPPLPGQMNQQVPGMADGVGLPWDPYAQNNWVAAPARDMRLPLNITPQSLAQRQQEVGLSRETAGNVARTNNQIGAARAAGAQPPEYMRSMPPTNQYPVPHQGPFRTPRPPLPMAAPMSPQPMLYQGSPAVDGSASYWRGMGAPPTNQMPVKFVNQGRALAPTRPGGALARNPPLAASSAGESWNPRGTAYARADGGIEMGSMRQRGLVPRSGLPTPYQPPPVIEGQYTEVLPRGGRLSPAGFFMDLGGPDRTVIIGGQQVTIPNDVFGMRAMADQPITDPATGLGNMITGIRDRVKDRVGGAYDAWNARRPAQAPGQEGGLLAAWSARRPGAAAKGKTDPKQSAKGESAAPSPGNPAPPPPPPPQIEKYGLTPGSWSEGKSGNTQGYAERTKATLDEDQRARGEAYGRLTGLQPNAMNKNDAGYVAGLTEGFKDYQPGRNYADQIMRRNPTTQAAPRAIDPWTLATQRAEQIGQRYNMSPNDAMKYAMQSVQQNPPDAAMARLQYDMQNDPRKAQQQAALKQAELAQQMQIAQMNNRPNIFTQEEPDPRDSLAPPIKRSYLFQGYDQNGQPILTPLGGGNMGTKSYVDPNQVRR
jgi:hypothetical protein